MERKSRARSKSATRKPSTAKSPKGKPRASAKEEKPRAPSRARSRGRPRKNAAETPKETKKKTARSRSRSRSESVPRVRASSRSRRAPSKKKEENNDNKKPVVVMNDISRSSSRNNLSDVIRASLERELAADSIRRSSRLSEKVTTSTQKNEWKKEKLTTVRETSRTKKTEFGGWAGAIGLTVLTFVVVAGTLLGCTKDQCELKPFHIPRNWRLYLNIKSAAAVVGFLLLQTILYLLPIGRVVKSSAGGTSYRANGCLALILTGVIAAGAWYLGYPVTQVYERWISLATSTYILVWLLSLALFIKGGRAAIPGLNPYTTGNRVHDFFVGREINPVVGPINIKIIFFRFCLIGTVLVDALLLLKDFEVRKEVSPTLATLVALRTLYLLDVLWFEESLSSTFDIQSEGCGLLLTQSLLLHVFFSGVATRFVLTHRVARPVYALVIGAVAFLVGYFIYRASNLQKATFRKNPVDPAIAHLETISTNRGKKLLVSGWWGKVKHPNYLGDIILHLAITSLLGFTHVLPHIWVLFTVLNFIHRAHRDNQRCAERYQGAWQEYSRRVPYKLIPRIY